jgi:hypothetical protein
MREQGHEEDTIAHVCAVLRPAVMEWLVSGNFDVKARDVEEGIRILDIHFQRVVFGLLLHMARLAIENHHLRPECAGCPRGRA